MWLLVIILFTQVPGIEKITVLKTLATFEDCQTERNRIGFDMAESYPYERTFTIGCIKNVTQPERLGV